MIYPALLNYGARSNKSKIKVTLLRGGLFAFARLIGIPANIALGLTFRITFIHCRLDDAHFRFIKGFRKEEGHLQKGKIALVKWSQ
jgi:hypothetical protein